MLAAFVLAVVSVFGVNPTTVRYATIDGRDMMMDVYLPADTATAREAVIFAFGGAFIGGERNNAEDLEYFNFLADNGVVAISIDYRPTLKKNPQLLGSAEGIAEAFNNAVADAVSDFLTATSYVYFNAEDYGIDHNKIFASGSSAGAITALQAEYALCNGVRPPVLPETFNYAGVMSFAGAIFTRGPLTWTVAPCPMQLYHGDNDHNVPYGTLSWGPINFCGSASIASTLDEAKVPCEFFTFAGVDHRVAHSPMHDNLYDILGFIKRVGAGKERLSIKAMESLPGAPVTHPTKITIEDIIKANLNL